MAHAQSSASFNVSDWVINNGSDPRGGVPLASASFLVTADSIGGSVPVAKALESLPAGTALIRALVMPR